MTDLETVQRPDAVRPVVLAAVRDLADVLDSAEWRNEPLTGALLAVALRKATGLGGRRGSRLSTQLRNVLRRVGRERRHT